MTLITLCGSGKFRDEVFASADLLREQGFDVLVPPLHKLDLLLGGAEMELQELAWKGATLAHFKRIAKADAIYIVNPNGYMGVSTTLELGYACALQKIVIAMRPDEELARGTLFDLVVGTSDVTAAAAAVSDFLTH